MVPSTVSTPLTWLLLAATASTQGVMDSLSFGHGASISTDGQNIPGWKVSSSNNHQVQILSDRMILTPPVPGNARGALWADQPINTDQWTADLEFRVQGQDQGSGNLQLWFVKDKSQVDTSSVYTVGNFDGLGLLVDQYGGRGGGVRGFLNDGGQNFQSHTSMESLAFGHCDYAYRNLGRPSKLTVSTSNGLSVKVDDRLCFNSDRITLPAGYYFGVTAATGENPDSFEINKFVVSSGNSASSNPGQGEKQAGGAPPPKRDNDKIDAFPGAPEAVPDSTADMFHSSQEQFEDLHNRLQGLTHQVANIFSDIDKLSRKMEERHNEMLARMPAVPTDTINSMNRKLEGMDKTLSRVLRDVESKDYREHLNSLQQAVDTMKGGLTDHLPDTLGRIVTASAPRMGMMIFIFVGVQVMLAGAYIVYKRRRAGAPKKYL
ncbi:hypothetical protein MBLNU230_g0820t1 [Neophaeotheca triangularis]